MTQAIYYIYMPSPIGELLLAGDGEHIHRVGFPVGEGRVRHNADWRLDEKPFTEARQQLAAYFAGELARFELPLAPQGTAFQKLVWNALQEIPYGATCSYGHVAAQIGHATASRAVGAANGQNPIPIIIPCHRVIGSTGKLTGFAGGLPIKQTLLELEQRTGPLRLARSSSSALG